jgi:hypothetical protein
MVRPAACCFGVSRDNPSCTCHPSHLQPAADAGLNNDINTFRTFKSATDMEHAARMAVEGHGGSDSEKQADEGVEPEFLVTTVMQPVLTSICADMMQRNELCHFMPPTSHHNGGTCMCRRKGKVLMRGEMVVRIKISLSHFIQHLSTHAAGNEPA